MNICKIKDCPNKATRKGLCNAHYMQDYRRKHPPQSDNLEQFATDLPAIFKSLGISGYAVTYNNGSVTIKKLGSTHAYTWKP
jgi:hypothetical protein